MSLTVLGLAAPTHMPIAANNTVKTFNQSAQYAYNGFSLITLKEFGVQEATKENGFK